MARYVSGVICLDFKPGALLSRPRYLQFNLFLSSVDRDTPTVSMYIQYTELGLVLSRSSSLSPSLIFVTGIVKA